jgi:hypothetical protein
MQRSARWESPPDTTMRPDSSISGRRLMLYPGQTFAQLFFHNIEVESNSEGDNGQYIGAVDLIPKALSSERSFKNLRAL